MVIKDGDKEEHHRKGSRTCWSLSWSMITSNDFYPNEGEKYDGREKESIGEREKKDIEEERERGIGREIERKRKRKRIPSLHTSLARVLLSGLTFQHPFLVLPLSSSLICFSHENLYRSFLLRLFWLVLKSLLIQLQHKHSPFFTHSFLFFPLFVPPQNFSLSLENFSLSLENFSLSLENFSLSLENFSLSLENFFASATICFGTYESEVIWLPSLVSGKLGVFYGTRRDERIKERREKKENERNLIIAEPLHLVERKLSFPSEMSRCLITSLFLSNFTTTNSFPLIIWPAIDKNPHNF